MARILSVMQNGGPLLVLSVTMLLLCCVRAYPSVCTTPSSKPGAPGKPVVSNQFTVYVEAVMVDKNQTLEFLEYFDYDNNRGRLQQTKHGRITDYYYDYSINEMLIVSPDDYTCQVQSLSKSAYVFLLGDTNSSHIFSPAAALRFGGTGSPEAYLGKSTVRGIMVNQWQSCLDWPDRNTTMTITWSFVDNILWMSSVSLVNVPVECHVTGRVYSDDHSYRSFDHRYEFISFLEKVPPDSEGVFELPQGVVCPGMKNTKQLPPLPDSLSFTAESITAQRKVITYTEEKYDLLGRIVSYTFRGSTGFSEKYGAGLLSVIHDFNTGTEYVVDRERGNCTMSTITQTPDVGSQSDLVTLRLISARDMLQLDGSYIYKGVRTIRDMTCDVWYSEKHAQDLLGLSINATYEYAFLTSDWQTQDSMSAMFVSGVPVQSIVTLDDFGSRQTSVTNFYDFKASVPDIADDINLDSCFIGLPRNAITFSIARIYAKLLQYFEMKFKYAVRHNIAQAISVSPLRIANIAYRVQQASLDVSFDLLSVPPLHSQVVDPTTELSLDEATQRLADAVQNNRLVIELDVNQDQPTFIVADPRSLRLLRLNQKVTVTGAQPIPPVKPTPTPRMTTPVSTSTSTSASSPPVTCDQYVAETDQGYSAGVMVGSALAMAVVGGALAVLTHRLMLRFVFL